MHMMGQEADVRHDAQEAMLGLGGLETRQRCEHGPAEGTTSAGTGSAILRKRKGHLG